MNPESMAAPPSAATAAGDSLGGEKQPQPKSAKPLEAERRTVVLDGAEMETDDYQSVVDKLRLEQKEQKKSGKSCSEN